MPVVVFVVAARRARSAGGRRGTRAAPKERQSAGGRRGPKEMARRAAIDGHKSCRRRAAAPKEDMVARRRAIEGAAPWTSSCGRAAARASMFYVAAVAGLETRAVLQRRP